MKPIKVLFLLFGGYTFFSRHAQLLLDVIEFGALLDTKQSQTAVFPEAINDWSNSGGRTQVFPPGTRRTVMLVLKNSFFLHKLPGKEEPAVIFKNVLSI